MAWNDVNISPEEIYERYRNKRDIKFEIQDTEYQTAVESFSFCEEMSRCFDMKVEILSDVPIDSEEVLRKSCLLTIKSYDHERLFNAIIAKFVYIGKKDKQYSYQVVGQPLYKFFELMRDCRIHQEKTIIEITKDRLREFGLYQNYFEFKGVKEEDYDQRKYCVQFNENTRQFLDRNRELEGIWYCFTHSKDYHKMIFGDKNIVCDYIQGDYKIPYNEGGMATRVEAVNSFAMDQRVVPGSVARQSHNYKKARVKLLKNVEADNDSDLEIYDYSCDYGSGKLGEKIARIRLEEIQMRKQIGSGTSNCMRFIPGFTFKLTGHSKALDRSYLITRVEHTGGRSGRGGDYSYSNDFSVIPESVTYRPPRRTPRTYVMGLQSATVVGPENGKIHSNEFGGVKVQFHWDRLGKNDENSSCWLRVSQPWAGQGRGAIFMPRVGDEVIVDFMGGNPDFPIIVGCAYNSKNIPFYGEAQNSMTSIKTRSLGDSKGFNELRFDDKAGGEEIFIHGQKDCNITVKSRMGQTIGGDSGTVIGGNKDEAISGDSYREVKGSHTDIAREITLSANDKISLVVGGSSVVITASDIKINGTKVYANDGSSAAAPPAKQVSGSLGSTGKGAASPSSGVDKPSTQEKSPAPSQQLKKESSPQANSAPSASAAQDAGRSPELGAAPTDSTAASAGNAPEMPKYNGWTLDSDVNNDSSASNVAS